MSFSINETACPAMNEQRFSGISLVGGRRHNEDCFFTGSIDGAVLLVVADGLGGRPAGEVASDNAVETVVRFIRTGYHRSMSEQALGQLMREAFQLAHHTVVSRATGSRKGMATTLVAALVSGNQAIVGNTGDSRLYQIGDTVKFRTHDHSVVQRLIDSDLISEAAARSHPERNLIDHTIGSNFAVDIYHLTLNPGEWLLLTTDGVHDVLTPRELLEGVVAGTPALAVRRIAMEAAKTSTDNITVVAYRA